MNKKKINKNDVTPITWEQLGVLFCIFTLILIIFFAGISYGQKVYENGIEKYNEGEYSLERISWLGLESLLTGIFVGLVSGALSAVMGGFVFLCLRDSFDERKK